MNKVLILFALREIKNMVNDKYYRCLQKLINSTIKSLDLNIQINCLIIHNSSIEYNMNLPENFKLITKKNSGHGWYGWKIGLDSVNIDDYNYYCFIKDKTALFNHNNIEIKNDWINKCIDLIKNNVIMISYEINLMKSLKLNGLKFKPHCKAQFLFLNRIALDIMLKDNIFINKYNTTKERYISKLILNKQYNINCLKNGDKNIDYVKLSKIRNV